jgi:hypothetical protein
MASALRTSLTCNKCKTLEEGTLTDVQGGAEPTDTFQMVIDNIWKQGKISEFVYKYVQVGHLLPTDYKLIKLKECHPRCVYQNYNG